MTRRRATDLATTCPECKQEVGGYVVRAEVLTVEDIVQLLGGVVNKRTVTKWIVDDLLRGYTLPGVRGWLVDVVDFESGLERLKRRPRRGRRRADVAPPTDAPAASASPLPALRRVQ